MEAYLLTSSVELSRNYFERSCFSICNGFEKNHSPTSSTQDRRQMDATEFYFL